MPALAGALAIAVRLAPANAADPPFLHWSWIGDTHNVMVRCGALERQHRLCNVENGLSARDRAAVAQRWAREGFHSSNIEDLIGRWRDRAKTGVGRPACPAVPAEAARDAAACRRAAILCQGKPCDLNNLPRRMPGEIIIQSGMPIADCGYAQWVNEKCGIKGGVDEAMRKRAFARLVREGFHEEDVAAVEGYWQDHYDMKDKAGLNADDCAIARKRATIRQTVAMCRRIRFACDNRIDCERYKPRRPDRK